jgi:CRP/FNR family transcriptional regulator
MPLAANAAEAILGRCRLLARLSPSPSRSSPASDGALVRAGHEIFEQDGPCPGPYCVGIGAVRVYRVAPNGKEHVLHVAGPGTTFGEVAAIVGADAPASAEAVQDTVCAVVPARALQAALQANHALCLQLLAGMAAWVKDLVGLLGTLSCATRPAGWRGTCSRRGPPRGMGIFSSGSASATWRAASTSPARR